MKRWIEKVKSSINRDKLKDYLIFNQHFLLFPYDMYIFIQSNALWTSRTFNVHCAYFQTTCPLSSGTYQCSCFILFHYNKKLKPSNGVCLFSRHTLNSLKLTIFASLVATTKTLASWRFQFGHMKETPEKTNKWPDINKHWSNTAGELLVLEVTSATY